MAFDVAATALALLLSGCAGSGSGGPAALAPTPDWTRRVDPFRVEDDEGRPYDLPFLGGFDAPRPQLVDLDGDGVLELVVQEVTGRLEVFARSDDPRGPFHWRPDMVPPVAIGEWFRFVDVDGDGDPDLLTESPLNYIRLYVNGPSAGSLDLTLAQDTLRDGRGAPLFSDRQNIPNAADLDCNGLLDLLVGRLVGTVTRFEATNATLPLAFRLVTDRFEGIEIVADPAAAPILAPGPPPSGGAPAPFRVPSWDPSAAAGLLRHGANTMALADVDADGDLDLFWGDFFEAGLLFIENTGTCPSPRLSGAPIPFPANEPLRTSGYNAPTFGDLDRDGDLDLLVGVLGGAYDPITTAADNLVHLVNDGAGGFRVESRRFLSQIDVGSESVATLVDLDADGDLDLLLGNRIEPFEQSTGYLYRFENVGRPDAPAFRRAGRLDVPGAYHSAPAFGDLDGDGDLDLLLGSWRPEIAYLENVGTPSEPRFELVDPAIVTLTRGSNGTPTLGDLDGDGDLDLLVGEASGALNYFRNQGGPAGPRFELVSDAYLGIQADRRSAPVLVDWEGDGDLDLAIGTEAGGIHYYENRGGRSSPRLVRVRPPFPAFGEIPAFAVPAFGDLDGDGDLDLVVGGAGGGARYYEHER